MIVQYCTGVLLVPHGAPLSPDPESRHHSPGLRCSALHVAGLAQGADVDSAWKWMDIGWNWWMLHCIEALTLQDGFDWNGLDGGSMWKSYIIWMPPPTSWHILAPNPDCPSSASCRFASMATTWRSWAPTWCPCRPLPLGPQGTDAGDPFGMGWWINQIQMGNNEDQYGPIEFVIAWALRCRFMMIYVDLRSRDRVLHGPPKGKKLLLYLKPSAMPGLMIFLQTWSRNLQKWLCCWNI